jgi:glycine/D-amino acid oxidase-like deaminating enzyme
VASRRVVVVGGGIVGCAAAYFLARDGADVTLLERERLAFGASGRNPGFVWIHSRNPGFALDISRASRRLYDELAAELDPFGLRDCGSLIFFLTPEQGTVMEEFAQARGEHGLDVELLSGADVRRLVEPIRPDVLGGTYSPLDAHIDTARFVRALGAGAERHGARIREGVAADGFLRDGERVAGVRAGTERFECDVVVLAAGVWTPLLARELDLALPIGAERLQVLATAPVDLRVEPLVYGPLAAKQYSLFRDLPSYDDAHFTAPYDAAAEIELLELVAQRADGSLLLGCPMDYPAELDATPTLEGLAVLSAAIQQDFPGLRGAPVDRMWAGLLPFTTDTLPVIDEVRPGLVVAAGHVYGNAAGPMTGKLLAALVAGAEPELDLSGCRLDRDLAAVVAGEATRW